MADWRKSKPFKCTKCRKDFNKESQLKRHMRDAHGILLENGEQHDKKSSE